jgi:hypothetical protein
MSKNLIENQNIKKVKDLLHIKTKPEVLAKSGGFSRCCFYYDPETKVNYLSKSIHYIEINIYAQGAKSTRASGKKGKPGKYLWEIWFSDLTAFGYTDTLLQAKKDCLYYYHDKCTSDE